MSLFEINVSGISINTPRIVQVNVQSESFQYTADPDPNTAIAFNRNTSSQSNLVTFSNFIRTNNTTIESIDFISSNITNLNWNPIFNLNTHSIKDNITNTHKPVSINRSKFILSNNNSTINIGSSSLSLSGIPAETTGTFSVLNNTDINYYSSNFFIESSGSIVATISIPSGTSINHLVCYQFLPSGIPNVNYSGAYTAPGSNISLVPITPTKNIQTNSLTVPVYGSSSLIAPSGLNKLISNIFSIFGFDEEVNTGIPSPCTEPDKFRVWDVDKAEWSECDCWEYRPSLIDMRTKDIMQKQIFDLSNEAAKLYSQYEDELDKAARLEDLYNEFIDLFQPKLDYAELSYLLVLKGFIQAAKNQARKYQKKHQDKVAELEALIYKNRHLLQDYTVKPCEPPNPNPNPTGSFCNSNQECILNVVTYTCDEIPYAKFFAGDEAGLQEGLAFLNGSWTSNGPSESGCWPNGTVDPIYGICCGNECFPTPGTVLQFPCLYENNWTCISGQVYCNGTGIS